jgi:hypothetical protein
MAKFHADELLKLQTELVNAIIKSNDAKLLQLPPENDAADNRLLVSTIVQDFVYACEQKGKMRTLDRKRFLDRINRPSLSKAFFSWKLTSRSKKRNQNVNAKMFAEPDLPWNVRHPRSRSTSIWEGVQAILLLYIAFSVPYRMAFNISLSDTEALVELVIDLYFVVDCGLNFHTAFYVSAQTPAMTFLSVARIRASIPEKGAFGHLWDRTIVETCRA